MNIHPQRESPLCVTDELSDNHWEEEDMIRTTKTIGQHCWVINI